MHTYRQWKPLLSSYGEVFVLNNYIQHQILNLIKYLVSLNIWCQKGMALLVSLCLAPEISHKTPTCYRWFKQNLEWVRVHTDHLTCLRLIILIVFVLCSVHCTHHMTTLNVLSACRLQSLSSAHARVVLVTKLTDSKPAFLFFLLSVTSVWS